ncbi:MAG: choice-of-anchor L domain-containing protein [Lewinellaceae bacterium]|nr:choice-of-anchor L domain-containing protein [Lewinellaceae bacterium]
MGTQFNDVFGFFISGPGINGTLNLATLPNGTAITTNNVNHQTNSAYYRNNNSVIFQPCWGMPEVAPDECELDGLTTVLTATANVQACQTYHIKLVIADITDTYYASAVFLRANSFNAGGSALAAASYPAGLSNAYEDCKNGFVRFSRDNSDVSQPLDVNFTLSGSATPGVDYTAINSPVTIPAGQSEILVPIEVLSDGIAEGPEQIVFLLDQPCSCQQSEIVYEINDKPAFEAEMDDLVICAGEPTALSPVISSGLSPYSFLWSNGATTNSIAVTTSGTYSVSITDGCAVELPIDVVVTALPQPVRNATTYFCPGETVTINGVNYTQPTVLTDTIPASIGCDTLSVHTLLYSTPAPSIVSVHCPVNQVLEAPGAVAVDYDQPWAESDCFCPGIGVVRVNGLDSGEEFPLGITEMCFTATDSCGNSSSCCFSVSVIEEAPCDVKEIGCMKYELMKITQNLAGRKTYSIRVTNFCQNEMIYTAVGLPNGVNATQPSDNSVYTGPSGRVYKVRNPNASPFHSVRWTSVGNGLKNGASEYFNYTLPPQSSPNYIHVIAKLKYQDYYEAHLNTFYCPVDIIDDGNRPEPRHYLRVFPNPSEGALWMDLSAWSGSPVSVNILDSRGSLVHRFETTADAAPQQIVLPAQLPDGLYFLDAYSKEGMHESVRFILRTGN